MTRKPAKRAIVFDLWGTLVPFPAGCMDGILKQIVGLLDASHPDLAQLWDETWPDRLGLPTAVATDP